MNHPDFCFYATDAPEDFPASCFNADTLAVESLDIAENAESYGFKIDSLENIRDQPVMVTSMRNKKIIPDEMQDAMKIFYESLGANVDWIEEEFFQQVWPIDTTKDKWPRQDCSSELPMSFDEQMRNCGFDLAGDILKFLLPNIEGSEVTELAPRDQDWESKGVLKSFN